MRTAAAHASQLLAEAFPALTLPAGANPVTRLGTQRNYNMPALFITDPLKWPDEEEFANLPQWKHTDVRGAAYSHLYRLVDKLVEIGGLK